MTEGPACRLSPSQDSHAILGGWLLQTPTTSKVVVKILTQHQSCPSVKAMQEIAAKISEAYDKQLDQEAARMKQDEQHFLQEDNCF